MEWLDLFCQGLSCTEYFQHQVQSQLSQQFIEQTGISLDGFVLVPPLEGAADIYFDQQGIAYLDTDLVAADANGYPVTIAWQCLNREQVLPSDSELQPNNTTIHAWWCELPVEDLKSQYASPRNAPWAISTEFPFDPKDYSFEVKWEVFAWPDVWLEVETTYPAFPQSIDLLMSELIQVWERWNHSAQTNVSMGIIHNLGSQQKVISPIAVVINIDFGSAIPKALLEMLQAIEKATKELGVRQVTCRSFERD
jgi:hypothetical protein